MAQVFHLFDQLPPELRSMIWSYCLPVRVCEIIEPVPEDIWSDSAPGSLWDDLDTAYAEIPDPPCCLLQTSKANSTLPLITQVCREARAVAFREARSSAHVGRSRSDTALPTLGLSEEGTMVWEMPSHEIAHLYDFGSRWRDRSLLPFSDQTIHGKADHGSFMVSFLLRCLSDERRLDPYDHESHDPELIQHHALPARGRQTDLEYGSSTRGAISILDQKRAWSCVVTIFVLHTTKEYARGTGFFGLLGDSPIQLVGLDDTSKLDMLPDLIRNCDGVSTSEVSDAFRPATLGKLTFGCSDDRTACEDSRFQGRIRPCIMVRLCTAGCTEKSNKFSTREGVIRSEFEALRARSLPKCPPGQGPHCTNGASTF